MNTHQGCKLPTKRASIIETQKKKKKKKKKKKEKKQNKIPIILAVPALANKTMTEKILANCLLSMQCAKVIEVYLLSMLCAKGELGW